MQSSNLESMGMKPSLFTDNVGEFSFCTHHRTRHDLQMKTHMRSDVTIETIVYNKQVHVVKAAVTENSSTAADQSEVGAVG